jgi:DNA anti-recombination protein RmuC
LDKEEENLIATLTSQNTKLKNQNIQTIEKNKVLIEQLERKKREVTALKRSNQAQLKRGGSISQNNQNSQSNQNFQNLPNEIEIRAGPTLFEKNSKEAINPNPNPTTDSNLLEVARKYKARYSHNHFSALLF